jgi:protein transport protein SEC61 subunit alpha
MRAILASNRGSLMELGISPIVTSGMIIQLLSAAKIIQFDPSNEEDASLHERLNKLAGIIIALFEAVAYVWGGMYGEVETIGTANCVLIVLQLVFASYMTILLDELMNNGYGLGSGINLFIAVNMCETILWETFSPMTVRTDSGQEYEGAVIALFHGLFTRQDKLAAIQ